MPDRPRKEPRIWTNAAEQQWQILAEEVFAQMKEWRAQHPTATFREIEAALDARLAKLGARLLQDAALASAAATLAPDREPPPCPGCGHALQADGTRVRRLTTSHQQPIALTRADARCPACGAGLFPPR